MNIIILGPQGSGKGTQSELLVDKFGLNYIEMGNILRSIANSNNSKAEEVKNFINFGKLVPDEFVRLIAWDHISKQDKVKGFLFDGYPRSLAQYEHVQDMLRKFGKKVDYVIYLDISDAESIKRLEARRTCEKCKEIFNLVTRPPIIMDVCDRCGGKLYIREDDTKERIERRLRTFHTATEPVLLRAQTDGILLRVNGEDTITNIHEEIVNKITD